MAGNLQIATPSTNRDQILPCIFDSITLTKLLFRIFLTCMDYFLCPVVQFGIIRCTLKISLRLDFQHVTSQTNLF